MKRAVCDACGEIVRPPRIACGACAKKWMDKWFPYSQKPCKHCGLPLNRNAGPSARVCFECDRARARYASSRLSEYAKALREAVISPASAYECVDCGSPAHEYDHRDYRKPLDVAPVCRGCNRRRGFSIDLAEYMKSRRSYYEVRMP